MRTIIVDDDMSVIKQFRKEAEKVGGFDIVGEFTDPLKALEFVKKSETEGAFELALLDIVMPGMNGLELMREIRKIYPKVVVFFISAYDNHVADALREKVDYYIFKPFDRETVEECAERARFLAGRLKKRIVAKTFGRFDLFVDGKLVVFRNAKAKELLALCVDHRGGEVTMEEAIDKLWEEREYDSRVKQCYRTAAMQLRYTLSEYKVADLFMTKRGACYIDANIIDCDLYDLLDEKEDAINKFFYVYMVEYPWSEDMVGRLSEFL